MVSDPMEKENYFKKMSDKGSTVSSIGRSETKPPEPDEPGDLEGNGNTLFSPLFIELAHRINNTLSSIKNITQLSRGKFRDLEFEDYFHRSVTDDIEKIESVINGLLNYIKSVPPLSNPIRSIPFLKKLLRSTGIRSKRKRSGFSRSSKGNSPRQWFTRNS